MDDSKKHHIEPRWTSQQQHPMNNRNPHTQICDNDGENLQKFYRSNTNQQRTSSHEDAPNTSDIRRKSKTSSAAVEGSPITIGTANGLNQTIRPRSLNTSEQNSSSFTSNEKSDGFNSDPIRTTLDGHTNHKSNCHDGTQFHLFETSNTTDHFKNHSTAPPLSDVRLNSKITPSIPAHFYASDDACSIKPQPQYDTFHPLDDRHPTSSSVRRSYSSREHSNHNSPFLEASDPGPSATKNVIEFSTSCRVDALLNDCYPAQVYQQQQRGRHASRRRKIKQKSRRLNLQLVQPSHECNYRDGNDHKSPTMGHSSVVQSLSGTMGSPLSEPAGDGSSIERLLFGFDDIDDDNDVDDDESQDEVGSSRSEDVESTAAESDGESTAPSVNPPSDQFFAFQPSSNITRNNRRGERSSSYGGGSTSCVDINNPASSAGVEGTTDFRSNSCNSFPGGIPLVSDQNDFSSAASSSSSAGRHGSFHLASMKFDPFHSRVDGSELDELDLHSSPHSGGPATKLYFSPLLPANPPTLSNQQSISSSSMTPLVLPSSQLISPQLFSVHSLPSNIEPIDYKEPSEGSSWRRRCLSERVKNNFDVPSFTATLADKHFAYKRCQRREWSEPFNSFILSRSSSSNHPVEPYFYRVNNHRHGRTSSVQPISIISSSPINEFIDTNDDVRLHTAVPHDSCSNDHKEHQLGPTPKRGSTLRSLSVDSTEAAVIHPNRSEHGDLLDRGGETLIDRELQMSEEGGNMYDGTYKTQDDENNTISRHNELSGTNSMMDTTDSKRIKVIHDNLSSLRSTLPLYPSKINETMMSDDAKSKEEDEGFYSAEDSDEANSIITIKEPPSCRLDDIPSIEKRRMGSRGIVATDQDQWSTHESKLMVLDGDISCSGFATRRLKWKDERDEEKKPSTTVHFGEHVLDQDLESHNEAECFLKQDSLGSNSVHSSSRVTDNSLSVDKGRDDGNNTKNETLPAETLIGNRPTTNGSLNTAERIQHINTIETEAVQNAENQLHELYLNAGAHYFGLTLTDNRGHFDVFPPTGYTSHLDSRLSLSVDFNRLLSSSSIRHPIMSFDLGSMDNPQQSSNQAQSSPQRSQNTPFSHAIFNHSSECGPQITTSSPSSSWAVFSSPTGHSSQ